MKTIRTIYLIALFAASTAAAAAQNYPDEYLGLPGDNLNLYAVMNLFQESETLEKFERGLNDQENMINNLDLNGDNLIDYITVSDYVDGNVHSIVLRTALNRKQQQDIAVFIVEKLRNGAVQIQLIGDEALYGPNYIVEPIYAETPNPGYTGNTYSRNVNVVTTTYYDIAAWPVVRYIYHPRYVVWRSSWYWGYYPTYWRPWRAHYWHYYYGYHYHWHDHYYRHYRHWNHYRCRHYHAYYRPHVRVYSPTVIVNIDKGHYRTTYSRPDQRRAGEDYYARTASTRPHSRVAPSTRSNSSRSRVSTATRTSSSRSTAVRSNTQTSRSGVRYSSPRTTSQRSATSVQRTSTQRSAASVQRTGSQRSTPSVQRTGSQRSTPSVQRSSGSRTKSASVQRSTSQRSTPSVQRSSGSRTKSASVQRSTSQRSTPSVQRSSGSQRSAPSVQRSSGSQRSSSRPSRR